MIVDRNNDIITSNQLFSVLITLIVGIGVLSLPRALADKVGPDSLFLVVIGTFIFMVLAWLTTKLIEKFPNSTIIEIGEDLMGKPIGILLGATYFLYIVLLISLEIRAFGEITKSFLLISTPIEVLMISFLLVAAYTVRSGIECIARMSVLILPLSLIPALIVMPMALPDADLTNFLPILRTPPMDILKSIPEVLFSFLGFEFILFLGFFVKDHKKVKKTSLWAIFTISIIYIYTVFITIARFGVQETKSLIWPVLTLFKNIDIPGTILENVEIVILSTWILSIFMTIVITYFGAVFLFSRLIKSKEHNYLVLPLLPIVYIIALVPENVAHIYTYLGLYSNVFGSIFGIAIPIILLIVSLFKRRPKKGMRKGV